jgi:hypothetical protein
LRNALSKEIKGSTSVVSENHRLFDRAREVYLAAIKRAEVEYFARIKEASARILEASGMPAEDAGPTNSNAAGSDLDDLPPATQ